MADRSIRSLANLPATASTSRVLNLAQIQVEHGHSREWGRNPLFLSPILNRSLLLKHRLRRDELERFQVPHHVATKILLPFDPADFRAGGQSVFVHETGFRQSLQLYFGVAPGHPDFETLEVIDRLPSLDPFLLREQLRRHGLRPADCYFSLSRADLAAMSQFVSEEISPLVNLCVSPDIDLVASNPVSILMEKILSDTAGEDLGQLGLALQLEPGEYSEGVFSWKGFLYYKWVLRSIISQVIIVVDSIRRTRPLGRPGAEQHAALERLRETVVLRVLVSCDRTATAIKVYDDAFEQLTQEGRHEAFRDFLRAAPSMFAAVGEQLGALQHIVSFWRYRMSSPWARPDPGELIDLLADFEISLMGGDECPGDTGPKPASAVTARYLLGDPARADQGTGVKRPRPRPEPDFARL